MRRLGVLDYPAQVKIPGLPWTTLVLILTANADAGDRLLPADSVENVGSIPRHSPEVRKIPHWRHKPEQSPQDGSYFASEDPRLRVPARYALTYSRSFCTAVRTGERAWRFA